jgi:hypothetical protein
MTHIIRIISVCLFAIGTINSKLHTIVPTHQMLFIGKKGITVSVLQKRFKTQKPAVYVDFHGVIGIKNINAGVATFKERELSAGVQKARFIGRALKTAINPIAMAKMIKLGLRKNKVTESYLNVIKNHGSKKLHRQAIKLSTEIYEPNAQMIDLLYRLRAAGCRIYLFSNGGYETMQAVKKDPRFKTLFEGPDPLFTENCINTHYEKTYNIAKPSSLAFKQALNFHKESSEYSIFIDDSREKLCDWRNKTIQKRDPQYNDFWACSLLYHADNHTGLELTLKKLNIL